MSGWMIPESQIEAEFRRIDTDGSGFIDASELITVLKDLYGRYDLEADPEAKAKVMLERADSNQDGKIALQEFKDAFKINFGSYDKESS